MWGRKFVSSQFQWLPTNVNVDENGKCTYLGYINNLDEKYQDLYKNLEELLGIFIPEFEDIIFNYLQHI